MNRICEDIAGYELWSTSGSSKRMPDSAHEVPRVGALAQLNSHFDVGKVYSGQSQIREVMQYNYPRGEEHGYRFTTAFTFSVRTPKKDYPIVTDMNPLTVASKASITHVQSRRGQ